MATDIVLRSIKAASLTHAEMDQNWESLAQTIDSQTVNYTILTTDQNKIIEADISSGTITLPTVASAAGIDTDSFRITIKNINASNLELDGNGADTIDSDSGITLFTDECVTLSLSANAAEWTVIAVHGPNLTGISSTSVEINYNAGVTAGTALANKTLVLDSVKDITGINVLTSSTVNASTTLQIAGVNVTASAAELNVLNGILASTAELNVLNGILASTTELNYLVGVTSLIQTQFSNKQPLDADLTAIAALLNTDSNFIVGNGTTWVAESGNTARTSLGVGNADDVTHNNIIGNDVTVNGAFTSLGIDDNATTTAITIDSSERVGVNTTSPDNTLHVQKASAGAVTGHVNGVLTLENSVQCYLQFLSPNNQAQGLYFGDPEAVDAGTLLYNHSQNAMIFTVSSTEAARFDSSGDLILKGAITQGDNEHHYLGASNDIDIVHDGVDSSFSNNTGNWFFDEKVNSGLQRFRTYDSVGGIKKVMDLGGAVPGVSLYKGDIVEGSTLSGSLDGTNDLTIGGSTKIGKESKIDWANYNGVVQMSVEKGGTINTTTTTTTDYITIFIPANASTLRYAAEMSCDTDNSRTTLVGLNSATKNGTECTQIGGTAVRTFPSSPTPEGTLDVSDQQGNFIRLDVRQRNNATGGGGHTGIVYNFSMYFE